MAATPSTIQRYSTLMPLNPVINLCSSFPGQNFVIQIVDIAAILRLNGEIMEQQKVQTSMLQELLRRQHGFDGVKLGRLPDNIRLPVTTYAEITDLETLLKSEDIYKQVLNRLALFGGATVRECVHHIMDRIMENELIGKTILLDRNQKTFVLDRNQQQEVLLLLIGTEQTCRAKLCLPGQSRFADGENLSESYYNSKELCVSLEEMLSSYGMYLDVADFQKRYAVLDKMSFLVKWWIRSVCIKKNVSPLLLDKVGGKVFACGSFQMEVHTKGADMDTLCVAPKFVDRTDFFGSFLDLIREQPFIQDLRAVEDAYVPVIKMKCDGIELDMVFAKLNLESIPDSLDLRDASLLKNVNIRCVRSLNSYRVTDEILTLVPQVKNFRMTLRAVKLWAKQKGIYSNALGLLGGVSWAILVAFICDRYPNESPVGLLHKFFLDFSVWEWPRPVLLKEIPDARDLEFPIWDPRVNFTDSFHLMPIITPSYPQQNSAYNVTSSSRTLITNEMRRACSAMDRILNVQGGWDLLFTPSEFFRKYRHYIVIMAKSDCSAHQVKWVGLIESKIRILIGHLEINASIELAHVHPDIISISQENQFVTKWFIGLEIKKQVGANAGNNKLIDLTYDIQNFQDMVHRHASTNSLLERGMSIEVKALRRRELKDFIPEDVASRHSSLFQHQINHEESAEVERPVGKVVASSKDNICEKIPFKDLTLTERSTSLNVLNKTCPEKLKDALHEEKLEHVKNIPVTNTNAKDDDGCRLSCSSASIQQTAASTMKESKVKNTDSSDVDTSEKGDTAARPYERKVIRRPSNELLDMVSPEPAIFPTLNKIPIVLKSRNLITSASNPSNASTDCNI